MSDFSAEVTKGAALLDRVHPGWHKKIAVDRLAMESCDDCILGQLYGNYWIGYETIVTPLPLVQRLLPTSFGFTVPLRFFNGSEDERFALFRALADRWREAIKQREGTAEPCS